VKFVEPPPAKPRGGSNKGTGKWAEIAKALKERPGEWALIGEGVSATLVSRINKATQTSAFDPAGAFQATGRNYDNSRCDIYARYVGENGEHR
jgi:hypothetical protein